MATALDHHGRMKTSIRSLLRLAPASLLLLAACAGAQAPPPTVTPMPAANLWQAEIATPDGLAATAAWYRANGLLR